MCWVEALEVGTDAIAPAARRTTTNAMPHQPARRLPILMSIPSLE
jgi:hypothetical protein